MADTVTTEETTAAPATAAKAEPKIAATARKVAVRRAKTERKPRGRKAAAVTTTARTKRSAATPRVKAPAAQIKDETMNYDPANWMNLQQFATLPGADRFQTMFADAGSRGQQALEKSRQVAEDMTELSRANIEAMVEAGRIAATGVKSVGESALQRTRDGLEQNVAEFKSLAQAASPTEFFQRQSEIARSNFDRMVASFSQLTESTVKLAGEAIQPLSTRASVNAEKINELTA